MTSQTINFHPVYGRIEGLFSQKKFPSINNILRCQEQDNEMEFSTNSLEYFSFLTESYTVCHQNIHVTLPVYVTD